jgi:hypothetical protein
MDDNQHENGHKINKWLSSLPDPALHMQPEKQQVYNVRRKSSSTNMWLSSLNAITKQDHAHVTGQIIQYPGLATENLSP